MESNRKKIFAAFVVVLFCISGIGVAIAYTATVTNTGNHSEVEALDMGFFTEGETKGIYDKEIDNGDLLKCIGLKSTREYKDGKWTTTWDFADNDRSFMKHVTYLRPVTSFEGNIVIDVTVTIDHVKSSQNIESILTMKYGTNTPNSTRYDKEGMVLTFVFKSIEINSGGRELTMFVRNNVIVDASKLVGLSIGKDEGSTVIVTATPSTLLTLSFDGNGNTSGTVPSNISGYYMNVVNVPRGSDLFKDGHAFKEWNTSPDGTGTKISTTYTFLYNSITVYAIYYD